jgi:hypothetical protein
MQVYTKQGASRGRPQGPVLAHDSSGANKDDLQRATTSVPFPRINDEGFQAVLDVTKVRQASGQLLLLVRNDRFY